MSLTFQTLNEGFTCLNCQTEVPPAPKTCRNHCTQCLHSIHIDIHPGDRANTCLGILMPKGVGIAKGEIQKIHFECIKCHFKGTNKIADDDNRDALIQLASKAIL